jgi:ABC-2 type transport system permease protein
LSIAKKLCSSCALLPMIIHVVITLAAGYSVRSDFAVATRQGGKRRRRPVVALVGSSRLFGSSSRSCWPSPLPGGVLQIPFKGTCR